MPSKNLVVVGGPDIWKEYFNSWDVYQVSINNSHWNQKANDLYLLDGGRKIKVDSILWRLGPLRPLNTHRALLEMIEGSSVSCTNPADVLLKGYDRLTMLNEMRKAGLPVINYEVLIGNNVLWSVSREFPFVLKFGNYHGGYGKVLVKDAHQWADIKDTAYLIEDYVTIEDYIEYKRDLRCLIIGEEVFGTVRTGMFWKANHITMNVSHIRPPDEIVEYTQKAKEHLGADILGLDFLENSEGEFVLLESNDIPGIKEYPDTAKTKLAELVKSKIEN